MPASTVGYEKRFNWGLEPMTEDEFVQRVLDGQPEPPLYFAQMKRINREGPPLLHGVRRPERLPAARLGELLADGHIIVDTRATAAFAQAHVPGTINIPLNKSFSTWAGWLLPYDRDIHLIVDDESRALDEAVRDLSMIGLDRIAGVFGHDAVGVWAQAAATAQVAQTSATELHDTLLPRGVAVIDVRSQSEWDAGHLPGAHHVQLGTLPKRLDEVPRDGVVVVHCQGGTRSAIAASLLAARGYRNIINLQGGYQGWVNAGYPTVSDRELPMTFHERAVFPRGFRCASRNVGLKPQARDLTLFASDVDAAAAAVFTRNQFPGAPDHPRPRDHQGRRAARDHRQQQGEQRRDRRARASRTRGAWRRRRRPSSAPTPARCS